MTSLLIDGDYNMDGFPGMISYGKRYFLLDRIHVSRL